MIYLLHHSSTKKLSFCFVSVQLVLTRSYVMRLLEKQWIYSSCFGILSDFIIRELTQAVNIYSKLSFKVAHMSCYLCSHFHTEFLQCRSVSIPIASPPRCSLFICRPAVYYYYIVIYWQSGTQQCCLWCKTRTKRYSPRRWISTEIPKIINLKWITKTFLNLVFSVP